MRKIKYLGPRDEQARKDKGEGHTTTFPKHGKVLRIGDTYTEKELDILGANLVKAGQAKYVETVAQAPKRAKPTTVSEGTGPSGKSGPAKD